MPTNKQEDRHFSKFMDMLTDPDNIPIILISISKNKHKGYGDVITNVIFDKEATVTILRDVIEILEHENLSSNN